MIVTTSAQSDYPNRPVLADLLHGPEYDAIIDDFLARHGVEKDASDDEVNPAVSPIVKSAKREG
jgi:hypothetical protein